MCSASCVRRTSLDLHERGHLRLVDEADAITLTRSTAFISKMVAGRSAGSCSLVSLNSATLMHADCWLGAYGGGILKPSRKRPTLGRSLGCVRLVRELRHCGP